MKLCASHWTDLTADLKRKGMWHLVNPDPVIAAINARRWLAGESSRDTFDPLVAAVVEIYGKAADFLEGRIGQHQCPLCEINRKTKMDLAKTWVDDCSDAMLAVCLKNGISTARH